MYDSYDHNKESDDISRGSGAGDGNMGAQGGYAPPARASGTYASPYTVNAQSTNTPPSTPYASPYATNAQSTRTPPSALARYAPPARPAPYAPYAQYKPPGATQQQPARRQASGGAKTALLIIFCILLATIAGFAGGLIANINRPVPSVSGAQPDITYPDLGNPVENFMPGIGGASSQPDIFETSNLANNRGEVMTTPEVAVIVKPSVVEIKTETVTTGGWTGTYISEGAGSGVIISEDGYIITNDHVISGASTIAVRLVDGREFPASLIASDTKADIAVIKISETGLSPAVFGDSTTLVVGESILAVGNPLGELGGTVTAGIISALDREMIVEGEAMTLLQTDAAVNPGNSGGGLFNMRAELIGIVNSKSSGLSIEGLGFAIPSNIVKGVASDLLSYGYVRGRVDMGLELVDIQTSQAVRWYRVSQTGLYIISSVDERLKNGDRITSVDGIPVTNLYDFNEAIKDRVIGDSVRVTVSRGNDNVSADIMLYEWKP